MLYLSPIYWRGGTVILAPRRVKYWEGLDSIADSGVFIVDTTGCRLIGGSICGEFTCSYTGVDATGATDGCGAMT